MKVTVIPIVTGVLGTVTKGLVQGFEEKTKTITSIHNRLAIEMNSCFEETDTS